MCGIVFSSVWENRAIYEALNQMEHRGPDFKSSVVVKNKVLGHVRLSLVDLDNRSNQPMTRGKCHIVFNGEIYNYKELRQELESCGYSFTTNGDTEVLLCAIDYWGECFYEKIDGPYAFVFYNDEKDEILFSVDIFGEKQLYYNHERNGITISSLFQILNENGTNHSYNQRAIDEFYNIGYIGSEEQTIVEGINKVSGSFIYTYNFSLNVLNKTRKVPKCHSLLLTNFEESASLFHDIFTKVLKSRLSSEVKYGLLLSGGVDSTYILCKMILEIGVKPKCFSIMSKNDPDYEVLLSLQDYFQLDLTIFEPPKDFQEFYIQAIDKMDTPFYDAAYFSLYYLISKIDKSIKVLICGDGADELFYSYSDTKLLGRNFYFVNTFYYPLKYLSKIHKHFAKYLLLQRKNLDVKWSEYLSIVSDHEPYDFEKTINQCIYKNMSERLLLKTDKASMAFSKEIRTPFLNVELAYITGELRKKYYISDKKIMKDYIHENLPFIGKIKKTGFNSGGMIKGFSFLNEPNEKVIKDIIFENVVSGYD